MSTSLNLDRSSSEHDHKAHSISDDSATVKSDQVAVAEKSRGVEKMELLVSRLDNRFRLVLYALFTVLAFVMSLGQLFGSFPKNGNLMLTHAIWAQTSTRLRPT